MRSRWHASCLVAIDAFSEINVIEDYLFLGFIYLVDYPILSHSIFPETFQFTDELDPHVWVLREFLDPTTHLQSQPWMKTPEPSKEDA